jgi:hypothetical protein
VKRKGNMEKSLGGSLEKRLGNSCHAIWEQKTMLNVRPRI